MSTRRSSLAAIVGSSVLLCFALFAAPAIASGEFGAFVPGVSTGDSFPDAQSGSAVVHGRVNSTYTETYASCSFEYGTDTTYNLGAVPCVEEEGPFSAGYIHNVNAEFVGLESGVTYHYRLVATTAGGLEWGLDQTFTEEASPAIPGLPINSYSSVPSTTQAGGHPEITTAFYYRERVAQNFPGSCFCEDPENITTHLPTGVIGNPHATPYCTAVDLSTHLCPPDSQIGWTYTFLSEAFFFSPVYNAEPDPDQAGLLEFEFPFTGTPAFIELSARTGSDYGLDATLKGIEQIIPPEGSEFRFWGVPSNPSHDAWRAPLGWVGGSCIYIENPPQEIEGSAPKCFSPTASTSPRIPFFDSPTACGEPLTSSLEILSYTGATSELTFPYPATTGCDQLSFNPSLSAQPTATATDTPSGLEVDLSVPQQVSPETPSPSEIRATTVKLPEGFSINPSAADGKSACTDAEARLGTSEEAQCPETSKIGSVGLNSSALPGVISGSVYLLEPKPGDRYRILLSADGFATHVKLLGSVTPDLQTGRLTTSFPDLPQSPLTDFNIHFFGSERGLLATPTQCGRYAVESTFTPWDSALPEQSATQFFNLDSGPGGSSCPGSARPFGPAFQASSVDSTAAAHTPFSLELTRPDGDQNLAGLTVKTPPGLLATLKGIPYCSDAALAAAAQPSYSGLEQESNPSCPSSSQIGTAQAGAGAGSNPVYLPGKVYLAGPYKGAPLSLAVITPAVSGPYDLGNVVVRAALQVNPETAQVTAVSDPLPQILEGIPLRLRSIRISLNRPNFTLNPTNCDPFSVNTEVFGSEGTLATPSAHFQVANCAVLPFAPQLALKLKGSTKRAGTPALTATVTYPKAPYANIAKAQVALPHSEFLDNAHIGTVCTRPQLAAEQCPPASVYGHASAVTPLLEKPLEGPVYLGTGYGTRLPELVADLGGQIHIILRGKVDTDKEEGIRNTFEAVPDAPVSKFTISLDGGHKSLLENSENLCAKPQRATVRFTGQNGKADNYKSLIANSCGHKAHNSRRAHR